MKQNVGPMDRTARILGGLALATLGTMRMVKRRRGLLMSLLGLGLFTEGLLGYCLFYGLMGLSTKDAPAPYPEPWH